MDLIGQMIISMCREAENDRLKLLMYSLLALNFISMLGSLVIADFVIEKSLFIVGFYAVCSFLIILYCMRKLIKQNEYFDKLSEDRKKHD